ncbi:MAG TPA: histidine kinase N-terminal domain-containing protein [Anaerolineae bacterium]|nr:histidine kinase N-terminal domain-containing protein [Anaerolineae bacterium]
MDEAVFRCPGISDEDTQLLRRIEGNLPILADISRADLLVYCRLAEGGAVVVAQAGPHSVPPIYDEPVLGQVIVTPEKPAVLDALDKGDSTKGTQGVRAEGAPVIQEAQPIYGVDGSVIAALSVEKTMIEQERHRHRPIRFRKAIERLQSMVLQVELYGLDALTPFGEQDGILLVDRRRRVRYASDIATNLYRRLRYMDTLEKKELSNISTGDDKFVEKALEEKRCLEEEAREGDRVWLRKAIPIFAQTDVVPLSRRLLRLPKPQQRDVTGVLLLIHDATEARRVEKEARIRAAMIQEIHHRVKNNLQTIASLLRLQARRAGSKQVQHILLDSVSRILSVAAVHEFLSEHESRVINIKDVSRRILDQMRKGVVREEEGIRFKLRGPNVYLPTQQATACALIINELLQNALEHGFSPTEGGDVLVELRDGADMVTLRIGNTGKALPKGFDLERDSHLGLTIVQTLVKDDLKGTFELRDGDGVQAIVTFPKTPLGGDRKWSNLE